MTRPPNHRGQGRKPSPGALLQVQIRVFSDAEAASITALSTRKRTEAMLATQYIIRTGEYRIIKLIDPLPCAILTGDNICGADAFVAHAHEINIGGQWAMMAQWILQPICMNCAQKMEHMYNIPDKK